MFIGENPIHINAAKGSIAEIVLMPGDPLRAKYIAENFLEDAKEICNLRNMLGFTGTYKGTKVSVVGSGMGMPSMGIYSWELFHYFNVKKIIRIGTCGVVSPEVQVPELILAKCAHSESNFAYTFDNYEEHITYPSRDLNDKIIANARELNYKLHVGDVTTMDVFGPYIDCDRVLKRIPKELNVIGEEMEAFALFHIANHFNREAACILTAVDSKFSDIVLSGEQRQNSLNEMITLALESIIK
ncbi:MAG: purine-nucleoside phosphorylase [Firmicutes bacterium]|nr:purine-nucleoside phosphorylase [Bacillota bacterium]